jgi:hypothetical protein
MSALLYHLKTFVQLHWFNILTYLLISMPGLLIFKNYNMMIILALIGWFIPNRRFFMTIFMLITLIPYLMNEYQMNLLYDNGKEFMPWR